MCKYINQIAGKYMNILFVYSIILPYNYRFNMVQRFEAGLRVPTFGLIPAGNDPGSKWMR